MDDYDVDGVYGTVVDTGDTSHVTGSLNPDGSAPWHRRISPAVYQWLIVVGALGGLWGLYYAFRSDIKINVG